MSGDNISTNIGKRIGEFLILFIYLFIDVAEFWDHHRIFSLSIAVAGVLALLLLDGGFNLKWIVTLTAISAAVCFTIYTVSPPVLPEETEHHGWLLPANEQTPPTSCRHFNMTQNSLVILLGNNAFVKRERTGLFNVLELGDCTKMIFNVTDDGLSVNVDVFDQNGYLSARIQNNEFHAAEGQYSYIERPNRSVLNIHDKQGGDLLSINFLNKNSIRVTGRFACKGLPPIVIDDDKIFDTLSNSIYSGGCHIDSNRGFLLHVPHFGFP